MIYVGCVSIFGTEYTNAATVAIGISECLKLYLIVLEVSPVMICCPRKLVLILLLLLF